MNQTSIDIELKNYKVREGLIVKRSRFRKEWRKRWTVITVNFIFTFESQQCTKPTQIIDLNELIGYKCELKKPKNNIFENILILFTNSSQYTFCFQTTQEKWSWLVTIQRLMDFKERGASQYNSIDKIRTLGFDSQDSFLYKKINKIKNEKISTFNYEEQQKRYLAKADELLNKLIGQQEQLSKRQLQISEQRQQFQRKKIIQEHWRQQIVKLNQRIEELQQEINTNKSQPMRKISDESITVKNGVNVLRKKQSIFSQKYTRIYRASSSISENSNIYLKNKRPSNNNNSNNKILIENDQKMLLVPEQIKFIRTKCIQYLFQQFNNIEKANLSLILQFLLKIAEKSHFGYQDIIKYQSNNHKFHQIFVAYFLSQITKIQSYKDASLIEGPIILLNIVFNDDFKQNINFYSETQRILIKWCVYFSQNTNVKILDQVAELFRKVYQMIKPINIQQSLKLLNYLKQLNRDGQYKEKFRNILSNLQ